MERGMYFLKENSGGMETKAAMLGSARAVGERLGDDADVIDAGNAKRVDDRSKNPKRDGFVATQKDAPLRAFQLLMNFGAKLMNTDGVVAKIDALRFVYGNDNPILVDIPYSFGLGNVDFDSRLEDRRGDHKDDEQYEDHVHERDHVDLGERSLRGFDLRHG